ncbi:hypothetical protein RHMOL_Rhmol02G0122200 [Rhododendron molle]|uniref:Uncharacterized protein n=1 Tax=Rhododendron molle TaxID=49168 RepID=A0ACC0PNY8_RHOML|nr:hypothetical protein RHMOL_Rhmol02G0122200 [Rhododendron molle]
MADSEHSSSNETSVDFRDESSKENKQEFTEDEETLIIRMYNLVVFDCWEDSGKNGGGNREVLEFQILDERMKFRHLGNASAQRKQKVILSREVGLFLIQLLAYRREQPSISILYVNLSLCFSVVFKVSGY